MRDYSQLEGKRVEYSRYNQPSPEAKKKGWERKRVAREMLDKMGTLLSMTVRELEDMKRDIENNPQDYTVLEVKLLEYLTTDRFLKDWLDRYIGKAPTQIDLTEERVNAEGLSAGIFLELKERGDNE